MDFPTTFTDSAGREWSVELGLTTEDRMKEITGFDLDDLIPAIDPKKNKAGTQESLMPLHRLVGSPRKMFDLFYAMVKTVADKRSLSLAQVKEGFDTAASVESMALAVMGAIQNFFRWDPMRNWILPAMVKMSIKLQSQLSERVQKEIDSFDIGKALDEQRAKISSESTGGAVQGTPVEPPPSATT